MFLYQKDDSVGTKKIMFLYQKDDSVGTRKGDFFCVLCPNRASGEADNFLAENVARQNLATEATYAQVARATD